MLERPLTQYLSAQSFYCPKNNHLILRCKSNVLRVGHHISGESFAFEKLVQICQEILHCQGKGRIIGDLQNIPRPNGYVPVSQRFEL